MAEHKWLPSENDTRRHCALCGIYEDYGKKNKCQYKDPEPVGRPALEPDKKRKPRSFKATDEEWQDIQDRAKEAGMSAGEYIRRKTLGAG